MLRRRAGGRHCCPRQSALRRHARSEQFVVVAAACIKLESSSASSRAAHGDPTPTHGRGCLGLRTRCLLCLACLHNQSHTHTRLTALCPALPGWASTRKVKPTWILLEQETLSGSEVHWAICKSAPCSRQITTPAPHRAVFLQAGCPSCRPTNSVKALKAIKQ